MIMLCHTQASKMKYAWRRQQISSTLQHVLSSETPRSGPRLQQRMYLMQVLPQRRMSPVSSRRSPWPCLKMGPSRGLFPAGVPLKPPNGNQSDPCNISKKKYPKNKTRPKECITNQSVGTLLTITCAKTILVQSNKTKSSNIDPFRVALLDVLPFRKRTGFRETPKMNIVIPNPCQLPSCPMVVQQQPPPNPNRAQ